MRTITIIFLSDILQLLLYNGANMVLKYQYKSIYKNGHIPMQKSVAATSIAIFIFSLYPVLPIASLTRSKPSLMLPAETKDNQMLKYQPFVKKFQHVSTGLDMNLTKHQKHLCIKLIHDVCILQLSKSTSLNSRELVLKGADEQDPVKKNLPGDVWSKPTILTNITPMGTIFFCNNSLLFLLTKITTNK